VTIQLVPFKFSGTAEDILGAPDDAAWVAVSGRVGHVLPDGTLDQTYDVGASVDNLAYGPDGRLWFTITRTVASGTVTTIGTLTPAGTIKEFPLKTPAATVTGLVAGADGNMWFGETGAKQALGRLTPDGLVTEFTGLGGGPTALVSAADGRLWYTGPGMLGSATTAGLLGPPDLGTQFRALAADPHNPVLWLGSTGYPGTIGRLGLPDGPLQTFTAGLSEGVQQLTPASDGDVWIAENDLLGRITPEGRITEYRGPLGIYTTVWQISGAPDGHVWFLTTGELGRVTLDPPAVAGRNPSGVGAHGATLAAAVTPAGSATTVRFEYGPTAAYGARTPPQDLGDGDDPVPATASVAGLPANQVVHYRAVATSLVGTTAGPDQTFTTTPEPVPADPDADRDGYPASIDCDDSVATIHPGAIDRPGDRIDQNCNGADARFPRFSPHTIAKWDNYGRAYSIFTALAIDKVPAATRVQLTCRGRGCRFGHWSTTVHKWTKRLHLLKVLKHSHLAHGSRLELRLTRKSTIGTLLRWNIGPPPRQIVRCLSPGHAKERAC
jgi:virginiamycin B lyase